MKIRIKKNSIAVCMLTTLMVIFSACSKEDMSYKKINGTWYLTDDPSCTWTFTSHYDKKEKKFDGGFVEINKIHTSDKVYNPMRRYLKYRIVNNTLTIYPWEALDARRVELNANLIIAHISKTRLLLSGTMQIDSVIYWGDRPNEIIYSDEIYINYEFKK